MDIVVLAVLLVLGMILFYRGRSFWAWVTPGALALVWWAAGDVGSPALFGVVAGGFGVLALVFGVRPLRRALVSWWVMRLVAPLLPRMGDTERIALEAGTVWWDGDLFSGDPDWRKLLAFKIRGLSEAERAFLDGPVEELCASVNEWEVVQRGDLPTEVWEFIAHDHDHDVRCV